MQDQPLTIPEQKTLATTDERGGLLSIIERAAKDPTVDIDKMERLLGMAERLEVRDAEKQFNAAFARLQSELPVIVAQTEIPNRGKYARFEDVMQQIQPVLTANGFSVSFAQSFQDNRVIQSCTLSHGGHSKSNSFAVRLGGRADSDTQADCKASTTAKRNALLNALNIVVRQDYLSGEDNPHNEGQHISAKDAADLRERVQECGADAHKFLQFAEAESFETIYEARMPALLDVLARKEKANRGK